MNTSTPFRNTVNALLESGADVRITDRMLESLATLPEPRVDATGATAVGGHVVPVGTKVLVKRDGIIQSWAVTVFRHDRNRTYRLHFADTDTYVTAHEGELIPLRAEGCPLHGVGCEAWA